MAVDPLPGGRLARLADVSHRRRRRVVLAWLAAVVAVIALAPLLAGEFDADFGTPGSESARAADLIEAHFPRSSGQSVNVVWQAPAGAVEPVAERRIDRLLADAAKLEGIGDPQPPRVSRDGTIALAQLDLDRPFTDVPTETGKRLISLAEEASGNGLRVELGGALIRNAQEGSSPEVGGLIVAAVILLVAFGSVVAAGLPLLVAIVSLGVSASLIAMLAGLTDVPDFAPAVAGLIGIGVGIDYALLILTRFRSALGGGATPRAATAEAVTTAGRSVLVAGSIVVVSLLGLFFMGVSFLRGVALSASLAVLVVMIASVTLLPALLGLLGRRVDRLRIPGLGRSLRSEGTGLSARWSRVIQRRPWRAALASMAVLAALTAPVLGLRFGFPDEGNDRSATTTRQAYELVTQGFGPGANGPLILAAEGSKARTLARLGPTLRGLPGVAFVGEPRTSPDGAAVLVTVVPEKSPQSRDTAALVHRLRDEVLPGGGDEVLVGGMTATVIDQSDLIENRLPIFVAGVIGLSFLLLLAAFRAPVIALKAGIMNLLSIAAAYGVVAYAAEGGWFGGLLGIDGDTPVPPFAPVMMFAVLFGLSMDYEVFLLSRMREEYLRDGRTSRAVAAGLAKTARVITAAAAIMVGVFLAFLLSDEVFLQLMGLGMATAIFVDATIVRMVLVPAVMQLMGRANWWIPGWLDRLLPRLDGEPRLVTTKE
jgi:putative drug exporter of the RND superfamily